MARRHRRRPGATKIRDDRKIASRAQYRVPENLSHKCFQRRAQGAMAERARTLPYLQRRARCKARRSACQRASSRWYRATPSWHEARASHASTREGCVPPSCHARLAVRDHRWHARAYTRRCSHTAPRSHFATHQGPRDAPRAAHPSSLAQTQASW